MPTLSSIVKSYLDKENVVSLLNSYDDKRLSDPQKKNILNNFIQSIFNPSLTNQFNNLISIKLIGSGTTGSVLSITAPAVKITEGIQKIIQTNSFKDLPIYRLKQSKIKTYPESVAIKIQMFYTSNKYWEARAIREEYILNKINDIADNVNAPSYFIKQRTPRYYLGFTVNFPTEKSNVKFRLTFMEVIEASYTIEYLISQHYRFPPQIVTNIEKLIKNLWRFGISHNDISIRNILVDTIKHDIKLIDFGLAELITPINGTDDILEKLYENYYNSIDKNEQDGSNVQKLKELIETLHFFKH
jgi:serine/threonine protein kinase